MKEKLKKFSKWLMLLPITVIGFIVYRMLNSKSIDQKAADSLLNAVKKDGDILAEQRKNVEKAMEAKKEAEEIGKKIEQVNNEEGDLKWHLKIKK